MPAAFRSELGAPVAAHGSVLAAALGSALGALGSTLVAALGSALGALGSAFVAALGSALGALGSALGAALGSALRAALVQARRAASRSNARGPCCAWRGGCKGGGAEAADC